MGVENLACEHLDSKNGDLSLRSHLVYSRRPFDNMYCSLTFLIAYYFTSALFARTLATSIVWCCWWCNVHRECAANPSSSNFANSFTLAAPVAQCLLLLLVRHVEVSELTGLCSLGVADVDVALKFVVLPSSLYSITALLFLLVGYKMVCLEMRAQDNKSLW